MKILQITNKFPYPAKDGGSIATLSLGRSLALSGHEVTILAINTSKHYSDPSLVPAIHSKLVHFISVPVNTDIKIIALLRNLIFSSLPYNAERFISSDFEEELKRLLAGSAFDIIQLEGLYLAPYLDLIRSCSGARVVMRAHNIEHEIWERSGSQLKGIRKWYVRNLAGRIRQMELSYLNRYDAIIPITARDGEFLARLGCELPMHTVPTGMDASGLQPDHSRLEFPSLFHIGALDWMPNREGLTWFFEKVWGKVLAKYPATVFYLAGRNAPGQFQHLPYPNVVYLGEVDDAYDFIRSKAVMIVPVLSGSGMRIKIIEGMALGKAIVTTTVGTEGIATTHGENILVADEPGAFAQQVCALIENREYCLEIGENARNFVTAHYDNLAITDSLVEFYQKLLR
jgi:glycosyltransferase involved in cell wall biosynthesis